MLHTISTKTKKSKRVGRGGAKGKNCGHGHKGQKSRAGKSIRPVIRDIIQRIPKRRGHNKNRAKTVRSNRIKSQVVNLVDLQKNFKNNDRITSKILIEKGLAKRISGKINNIKILANGDISIPLNIIKCDVSATARMKIEKAGGKVINK